MHIRADNSSSISWSYSHLQAVESSWNIRNMKQRITDLFEHAEEQSFKNSWFLENMPIAPNLHEEDRLRVLLPILPLYFP